MSLQNLWDVMTAVMVSWHQGKLTVEQSVPLSHDSLHVIVGVLIWLAVAAFLGRPITSRLPWLWILAIILWNETVDLWTEQWPDPWMQYRQGVKDILLTMFVPTVLMLAARFRPKLFRPSTPRTQRFKWRFGPR